MVGPNRGRYAVVLDGSWRLYTNTIPPGSDILGRICREGESGALIRTQAGILCQLNDGVIRTLNQRKAAAAFAAASEAP